MKQMQVDAVNLIFYFLSSSILVRNNSQDDFDTNKYWEI